MKRSEEPFKEIRSTIQGIQHKHRAFEEMTRGLKVPYFRRGEMSIPAFRMPHGGDPQVEGRNSSMKMMEKATSLPVDFFFYDLEDAAPDNPEFKQIARGFVVEAFQNLNFGNRVRAFRPNNIRSPYFEEDLIEVVGKVGDRLDAIVLPKTERAEEVQDVQKILREITGKSGHENRIFMEVLIESPRAFLDAEKIAAIEDVSAIILGPWDFAKSIGSTVNPDSWIDDQRLVRQMLPILAAAQGKEAIDGVTTTLPIRPKTPGNEEELRIYEEAIGLARRDALDAHRLGFAAKWVLHPDQIAPIQAAFTPSREEALEALKLAVNYTEAATRGSGSELIGNQLADKAVVAAEWVKVKSALRADVLSQEDLKQSGYSLSVLERTVRTYD